MDSKPAPASSRILITGAGGFIGARCWRPAPAPGTGRVRSQSSPQLGPDQVVVGDIDGQTDWSRALAGIDCVVHLAAHVHVMNPTPKDRIEFERTNVLARSVWRARPPIRRQAIRLPEQHQGERRAHRRGHSAPTTCRTRRTIMRVQIGGRTPPRRYRSEFGHGRRRRAPPLVYGAGVRANFLRLLSLAHSGLPLPLASIANVRSMVSVWNLCDLIRALLQHGSR